MVAEALGYKFHWAVADYLQRAARHIASKTDVTQAYELGEHAVELALEGRNAVMPTIERAVRRSVRVPHRRRRTRPTSPTSRSSCRATSSATTASASPTRAARYLAPLIQGEDYPDYEDGMPRFVTLRNEAVPKKLDAFDAA